MIPLLALDVRCLRVDSEETGQDGTGPARKLQGSTVRGREASEAGDLISGSYCKLQ